MRVRNIKTSLRIEQETRVKTRDTMEDLTSLDLITMHCVLAMRGSKDEQVQGDGVGAHGNSREGGA